jgi:hypothetical protein
MYGEDAGKRPPRRDDRRRETREPGQPRRKQGGGPRPQRESRDVPVKAREEKPAAKGGAKKGADSAVLGLTFEERMTYYKSKYAGRNAEEGAVSGSGGRNRRRKHGKPEGAGTAPAPDARGAKPRRDEAPRRHGKPAAASKPQKAAPKTDVKGSPVNTKAEAPKKGLLSRVLGIFTGKNRSGDT